jgi:hypothetical protein
MRFAKPGDILLRGVSSNPMLAVYAVRTQGGKGRLLVINKMRSMSVDTEIRLQGLRAGSQVTMRFYSAAQDSKRSKSLGMRTMSSLRDRISHRFPPMSVSVLEW